MECPWCPFELENEFDHHNTTDIDIAAYFHPIVCDKCTDYKVGRFYIGTTDSDICAYCPKGVDTQERRWHEKFDRVLGERFRKHIESGGRGIEIISRVSTDLD